MPRKTPAPKKTRKHTAAEVAALQPLIARCAVAAVKDALAAKALRYATWSAPGWNPIRRAAERARNETLRAGAALDKALRALRVAK